MIETRDVEPGQWHDAVAAARDDGFAFFDWLTAVDQSDADAAGGGSGFDVVCHLIDTRPAPGALRRLLLRTRAPLEAPAGLLSTLSGSTEAEGATANVPSITDLYAGAAWHERETHEMFGIGFDGFDDGTGLGLRPLLLPDGFEGTPLRKSFVLAARASKVWPGAKEPGESGDAEPRSGGRRKLLPPGVPDPSWGPR